MNEEFSDSITKTVVDFATQVRETEDEFIFETIAPFCRNTLKRTISKKELEEILLRAEQMKWIPCTEQPTSFDVEKVVKELEDLKMSYYLTLANTGDADKDCAYLNTANAIDRAIEIVKRGGRNEE